MFTGSDPDHRDNDTMQHGDAIHACVLLTVSPHPRVPASVDVCLACLYALQVRILEFSGVFQTKTGQAIKPNMR
jgi:hypothetical protein